MTGLVRAGDVEGEQAAEAGVPHRRDRGMVSQAPCQFVRGFRLAADSQLERLDAAAWSSGIVRKGFDGASSQMRSTSPGGGPVWSNSTTRRPQRSSSLKMTPVPKYAPSARAIVSPDERSVSTSAIVAPEPDENS